MCGSISTLCAKICISYESENTNHGKDSYLASYILVYFEKRIKISSYSYSVIYPASYVLSTMDVPQLIHCHLASYQDSIICVQLGSIT